MKTSDKKEENASTMKILSESISCFQSILTI